MIVGVIGGGPSAIMAAGIAAANGHTVYLIEKNNMLGKKLYITGKGRCNITNASDISEFFENIISNPNFLYSSLYSFDNKAILNLLASYGLEYKIERGNRVFPKSDKASDVIKAFTYFLNSSGVNVELSTEVIALEKKENKFLIKTKNKKTFNVDKVIVATGGVSYPATGSTGDGLKFAKEFGHTIIPLKPSLVPIELNDDFVNALMGLSLKNVDLKAYYKNKLFHKEFGEMMFSHFGITGPIVLSMSNSINKLKGDINLFLDFKPALRYEQLDARILRDFNNYINKQLKNSLDDLLPQKIIPIVIAKSGIPPDKVLNQITKEERLSLVKNIKGLALSFKGFRPIEEAIVTSGGVNTKEINPSTMESKLVEGLYFAGEVIDVDALTGGYNLQIAYSTGFIAGNSI